VDRKLYLSCLWPGLPELWWRGRISALPSALAFAAALNFFLVARFIYPEWLSLSLVRMAGWVGVCVWLFCVFRCAREMPALLNPRRCSGQPDRFVEAHLAYLQGKWAEAESLLSDCLKIENRDPPSLILLSGVYRHTGRLEAAARLIEEIRLTEAADGWWLEVAAEESRLKRDQSFAPAVDSRTEAAQRHGAPASSITPTASARPKYPADEVSGSDDLSVGEAIGDISDEIDRRTSRPSVTARAA